MKAHLPNALHAITQILTKARIQITPHWDCQQIALFATQQFRIGTLLLFQIMMIFMH
jgi:hypothetical protein